MEHRNIPAGQVGVPYNWRVANEAARNALVVSSADEGKLLQQDDNGSPSYWVLWAASPADWRPVSGSPGVPGESFDPDEIGPIANRGAFDNEPPPFSYLADDEGLLYFRIGEAGNWSQGVPFGQGPAGEDGAPGPGVAEGGTAGQFLRKVDDTAFSTYWSDVTSEDVGLESFDGFTPATLPISEDAQDALDLKANDTDVTNALGTKVDKVTGLGLSQESFTTAEKTKLSGIETGATANATDASLRDRSTHTGTQSISTVTGLQSALDDKASNSALSTAVSTLNTAIGEKANSTDVDQAFEDIELVIDGKAPKGAIGSSGLTMSSARLLGRSTASSGAVEEITLGAGLSLSSGTLSATALQSAADRQNVFLNWIYQSKLYAGYRRGINLFADGYKAADGINAGATSGYSLEATFGRVNNISYSTTTLNNNNSTLSDNASTYIDRSASVPAGTIVDRIGIFSTAAGVFKAKILLRNAASNYTVVVDQSFSHPGGGWFDCILSSIYTIPATGNYYIGALHPTGTTNFTSAVLRSFIVGDATGTSGGWTEDTNLTLPLRYGKITINNATLLSTAQNISSSNKARALIEYESIGSPTLNTDLTVELSADNGANWTLATLSPAGQGQNGRLVAETNEVSVNAGTSLVARIKTLNNKNIPIYGLAISGSS